MSNGVNKVILIGHVGRDPEIRTTTSGAKVATFSLATGESWRDKTTGERKERTDWHQVVVFNDGLVKIVEQYLKKGSLIHVEGKLQTRKYADRDGNDRYVTEVVLAQFRGELTLLDRAERQAPSPDDYGQTRSREAAQPAPSYEGPNDDIPF